MMKIIKHGIISKNIGGRGSYWGSVARLSDGRISAAWSGGRMAHVCPFGRVDIAYSLDGEKFSPAATVFDSPLDDRDAGLTAWGDKTVLTTFNNNVEFQKHCLYDWEPWKSDWAARPEEKGMVENYLQTVTPEIEEKYLGSLLFISDDGESFDEFIKMPITAPHGPIALENGKLLYAGRVFSKDQAWQDRGALTEDIYVMQTADGKTWSEPVPIVKGEDCKDFDLHEPHAAECDNGDILVVARAHTSSVVGKLSLVISRSTDGGKSFSPFAATGFIGAPPHLLKLKDGKLVLTYGRRTAPLGIRARISEDNGKSWGEEFVLRDLSGFSDLGYPSSVELENGKILTAYYACKHYAGGKVKEPSKMEYVIWEI